MRRLITACAIAALAAVPLLATSTIPTDLPDVVSSATLIVRGMSNLIGDVKALEDLERVRLLLDDLESKKDIVQILGLAEQGEGVRIFIGSESKLFSLSGSSLVVAPFRDSADKVVGVLGVIGPTRLNYARVVPAVNYTAQLVTQLLGR